jgi:hypothetical protein
MGFDGERRGGDMSHVEGWMTHGGGRCSEAEALDVVVWYGSCGLFVAAVPRSADPERAGVTSVRCSWFGNQWVQSGWTL